jgi:succinate dehydrogenase / fumarate reductase iron-sulfur subunit
MPENPDMRHPTPGDGGVQECGFAQNCVNACPKQLPPTEAISDVTRDVIIQQAKDFLTA